MKCLKRNVIKVLSITVVVTSCIFSVVSEAEEYSVDIKLTIGKNVININGEDKILAAPYIVDNIALAPLNIVSEGFGADVDFDVKSSYIKIKKGDKIINLVIDSNKAEVNGELIELSVVPEIKNGIVMVPIRLISENLGTNIEWNSKDKTINVKSENIHVKSTLQQIDNSIWHYNEKDDVFWQVGFQYCLNPVDTDYETLGIFVPAAYMNGKPNGDGTYTCELNNDTSVRGYTSSSAPIVIPINTPGYSSMKAPTEYISGVSDYTNAGFIYVNAGCRGRNEGAPAGITDLKAAVKYIRYNNGNIAGDMERIFTFGMSGGGAQSALMGSTGDSSLYLPYLNAIGAVEGYSDAVMGVMCWCPITNLDIANEAYEWNLGASRSGLSEDMQKLSDEMAIKFADYINSLALKDKNGNILTLEKTENGIYRAGTYYDYMKSVIETSLNNFLNDTNFPYTTDSMKLDLIDIPDGIESSSPQGMMPSLDEFENIDGINRDVLPPLTNSESKTYASVQAYINELNKDIKWINYDSNTNTATITNIEDFVNVCKNASKNVGAFDDINASQGENVLFGYGDGKGAHFDKIMAELLKNTEYGIAYEEDLLKTDSLGNTVDYRINMYNPMYFIEDYYDGYNSADVAPFWRIRTGINQGDTALSTEINLALALENYGVNVNFETVWDKGHVPAERTGDSTQNFIEWVNACLMEK